MPLTLRKMLLFVLDSLTHERFNDWFYFTLVVGNVFFMWVSSLEQRNIMKERACTKHSSHPMTALISRLKQFRPWVSGYFQLQYIKLTIWKYLHYPLNVKELWIVSIETLMSFIPFYRSVFVQLKILLVKFQ